MIIPGKSSLLPLWLKWSLGILLGCVVAFLFIQELRAIWSFTIDDMYITLRYAKHWAEGYGIVWNQGEPPVEGYSNFSFLLLARMAFALHVDPVLMLKATGVASLLMLIVMEYHWARIWLPRRFAWWPCLWLLAYRGQILWSVSGLETSVYQTLLMGSLWLLLHATGYRTHQPPRPERDRRYILAALGFVLASFTRPEAPALVFMCIGLMWCAPAVVPGNSWRGIRIFSVVYLGLYLPYFLWKWHYFGQIFPNSIYCKGFVSPLNLELDSNYFHLLLPFLFFTFPALMVKQKPPVVWLWGASAVYFILCVGSDPIVAFQNRLFLPAFALFLPLPLLGLSQLSSKTGVIYSIAFGLLIFGIPKYTVSQYQSFTQNPRLGEHLRGQVLSWLSQHTPKNAKVVLADCGMIPYLSELNFIDSYCLNNKKMTEYPRQQRVSKMCEQILIDKPEVIILTDLVEGKKHHLPPVDRCLANRLPNETDYTLARIFKSINSSDSYYQYTIYRNLSVRCAD